VLATLPQRPGRNPNLDPSRPHAFFLEQERLRTGQIADTATILLTNKQCPWRCLMCDLWKNTLPHSVPPGAIPQQIDHALSALNAQPAQVKLYNSGSFFDATAIPRSDYPAIAQCLSFAANVIVESHPRLVGKKALQFASMLKGSLEVAMGLETIHPRILPRLNKRFELADFEEAAKFLVKSNVAVRAFVLVNPPFLGKDDGAEWAVKSARFAFDCGASVVSLIPTRAGVSAMDELLRSGEFVPPRLRDLEDAHDQTLHLRRGRVFADTWDLEKFSKCNTCFESRHERLRAMNLSQILQPRIPCSSCARA
jgi:archaeosine synthase beta-subunit